MVENFPNMEKEIVNQAHKVQSPTQDKPQEKHIKTHINQTNKIKHKERILKNNKGKATSNIQGKPHTFNS